jgi:hypothetical protein
MGQGTQEDRCKLVGVNALEQCPFPGVFFPSTLPCNEWNNCMFKVEQHSQLHVVGVTKGEMPYCEAIGTDR